MATWKKADLARENGELAAMQLPVIVSASRSTDIPAFYSDWFFHRLAVGYSAWTNPFNGVRGYVSYRDTRFIVFWSKNPRPLLRHLDELRERGIGCYVQFTLNDYERERMELGVPPLAERIDTFRRLVDKLGVGGVVWRFDPLMLTDSIDEDLLLEKVSRIAEQLRGYSEKLVFSYADIATYRKVKANLTKAGIAWREWDEASMLNMARQLAPIAADCGMVAATCGERIDLSHFGIAHNSCIDDTLIVRRAPDDQRLLAFLKAKVAPLPSADLFGTAAPLPRGAVVLPGGRYATLGDNRDTGQREACGCIKAKDIGEYNTCPHLCEYCYANASKAAAVANFRKHQSDPLSETITG